MSEPWRHKAACNGHDTSLWFPESPGINPRTERAVAICRSCPVAVQCLQHAQSRPEVFGIWGGLTERERRGLRNRRTGAIAHGTQTGYLQHYEWGEPACADCKRAHNEYQRARRRIRERAKTRDHIEEVS